ncbi:MAG: DUF3549 family protein [Aeromonas sp.]
MSAVSSAINTLSEFLTHAGTEFQLFDLGRQVRPLDSELFTQIEAQQTPYPWPLQQHAWLGVHFFIPGGQHYLWFLKFPLDEQGLLQSGGPKQFMAQVVELLGQQLTGELDEDKAQQLAQNPFIFRPAEVKLAGVHAKLARQLDNPPSLHLAGLEAYLTAPALGDWQRLGLQGFADLAERVREERYLALTCKALAQLPDAPLYALCQALESVALPPALQGALLERLQAELACTESNDETLAYVCRALASCPLSVQLTQHVARLLTQRPSQSVLLAIAGRLWPSLRDAAVRSAFLEALAGQVPSLFAQVFSELVMLPDLRPHLLAALRDPARSPRLSAAIGRLFAAAQA